MRLFPVLWLTSTVAAFSVQPYSTTLKQLRSKDVAGAAWSQDGGTLWTSSNNGTLAKTATPPFDHTISQELEHANAAVTVLGAPPLKIASDALSLGVLAGVGIVSWRMVAMTSGLPGGGGGGGRSDGPGGGNPFFSAFRPAPSAPVLVEVEASLKDVAGLDFIIDEEVSISPLAPIER